MGFIFTGSIDYANPILMYLRKIGQKLGILRPVLRLYRHIANQDYEEAFDAAFVSSVRHGDCIWDVGANVGFYAEKLAVAAGEKGLVLAFEPSPRSLLVLEEKAKTLSNLRVMPVALSNFEGEAPFQFGENSVTDSMVKDDFAEHSTIVKVEFGDTFRVKYPPQIIKIDVEGFELDVLKGLSETLKLTSLRAVFVEVHFLELAHRGLNGAPSEIKSILERSGFRIEWVDASHIVAKR